MSGSNPDKSTCCLPSRSSSNGGHPESLALSATRTAKRPTDLCLIEGGTALIGTNTPCLPIDEEGPLRSTKIKPFLIEPTTVTNERFAKFVEETGYVTDAERIGNSFVFVNFLPKDKRDHSAVVVAQWWKEVEGATWQQPAGPDAKLKLLSDHPVVQVTWNDAVAFAKWVGGRLPTEAEWEHAARGGLEDVRFPWGDKEPNDHDYFPCNIWQGKFPEKDLAIDGYAGTAPARSFEPNGYGLYNMVGNVWEMTSQAFKVRSLKKDARVAQAHKRGFKILKGGSFLCHSSYCFRYRIVSRSSTSIDSSTSHQGFRIVYDLDL